MQTVTWPPPTPEPLTPDEGHALTVAHDFVRRNCYTHLKCKPTEMQPEFIGGGFPLSIQYEARRDSLKPWAYGISRGVLGRPGPGWTVYFEVTEERLRQYGTDPYLRGVYLSESLTAMGIEHLPLRMDAPDRLVTFVKREAGAETERGGRITSR